MEHALESFCSGEECLFPARAHRYTLRPSPANRRPRTLVTKNAWYFRDRKTATVSETGSSLRGERTQRAHTAIRSKSSRFVAKMGSDYIILVREGTFLKSNFYIRRHIGGLRQAGRPPIFATPDDTARAIPRTDKTPTLKTTNTAARPRDSDVFRQTTHKPDPTLFPRPPQLLPRNQTTRRNDNQWSLTTDGARSPNSKLPPARALPPPRGHAMSMPSSCFTHKRTQLWLVAPKTPVSPQDVGYSAHVQKSAEDRRDKTPDDGGQARKQR